MSSFSGDVQIAPSSIYSSSSTQELPLGARATMPDGRSFRYCKAGAVALVQGKLQQAAAEVTNHQNLTPAAAAIGATSVTVTLGATAASANQYAEGFLNVTVTPGEGYSYKIKSHPAANASATLTLTLEDPILVALTTSSRCDLAVNQYKDVIVNPTTATSNPVGVAVYPISIGGFGWIQTGGIASVLADGTVTVGTALVASNGTAGAVEALTGVQAPVGIAVTGIATTEYGAVRLLLDS